MKIFTTWLLLLVQLSSIAQAGQLNVCPRMPIATAVSNQFLTSISAAGATTLAQPSFTNLSGSVAASQMPALTGDITTSAGAVATTLATVNSNVGTFGDATHVAQITVNGKGLVTAASSVSSTITKASPTVQTFTSGSSATYNKNYAFIITSGSATVGATYTNNAITFTVWATVASATEVIMSGSGPPAASGTLTKASGTGDSTLTFSQFLAPQYLRVRGCGGGGGGGGGSGTGGTGGTGGNTLFGSSLLTGNGGVGGGGNTGGGGVGGTASIASPAIGTAFPGARGDGGLNVSVSSTGAAGGMAPFGGGSGGGSAGGTGSSASTNSCSGGSGGGSGSTGGGGGGAGGFFDAIIRAPSATYTYTVGGTGSAGSAGTGTTPGTGAAGYIEVTEYYQ